MFWGDKFAPARPKNADFDEQQKPTYNHRVTRGAKKNREIRGVSTVTFGSKTRGSRAGIAEYERLIWRNSAYTICQRHAAPLVLDFAARSGEGTEETSPIELTALERNLVAHLMRFESQIRGAWRGNFPAEAAGTLTAGEFLRVVQDLLTFTVGRWDAGRFPLVQTVEQQAYHLRFRAPTLFPRRQLKQSKYCHERHQPMQLRQLVDPAAHRAALWLVLQVIWYIPSGPPRLALRLGVTPQDEFFGSRPHAGWAWLTERALAWPARYRARHWNGFESVFKTTDANIGEKELANC